MVPPHHAPEGYDCPFCLVAAGVEDDRVITRQADVVYRDELTTAFVSSHQYPNNPGHVLVVPNQHVESLYEIPDELGAAVHATSRKVALAMKAAYGCDGVSTRQHNEPAGHQDVWHYHLHVFPRFEGDGLYAATSSPITSEERAAYAARLWAAWPSSPLRWARSTDTNAEPAATTFRRRARSRRAGCTQNIGSVVASARPATMR